MSKFNYFKNRESSRNLIQTKFDSSLNASNWVEFSLRLRNDEAIQFGAAYETIKYESKIRYWFPKMPVLSSDGDILSNLLIKKATF